ncbi:hypothetical protein QUF75_13980 [Desulfococcaceae bacterium HSG7]|nr:hypothetical protein [Desulfococcaceae bacterium HSG7]
MKAKNWKIVLIASAVLAFSATGLFVYQKFFVWSRPPAQAEYLPVDLSKSGGSVISVANAGEKKQSPKTDNGNPMLDDFSQETVGAMPVSFAPAVGNWIIGIDNDNKVLVVDGRKWSRGNASAGLADKARALYGERYAEFLDNVKAYAYYPFAVSQQVDNFTDGEITVRFKAIAGRIDQGAGILFDLKPNGDYYAVRANPLENNLVLWRFKHGKRTSVSWVRNVPTPTRKWHELKVKIEGNLVRGYLNGKQFIGHKLPASVSGKVGLWTKADSVVYFDDYKAAGN